mgnify:FL=1
MKFYSAKNVKQDDIVNVVVREILKLNEKILFEEQDNMNRMNRLSFKKDTNIIELENNDKIIESVEKSMSALEPIRHKLNVFNKIFEIITEEGEENEMDNNQKAV